jgi:hypothetical protein
MASEEGTIVYDIRLIIEEPGVLLFLPLLEKGVIIPVRTGCSIRDFFCGQLGLPETYLEQRIQTLFLNARPVDNVDTAVIQDGAVLALSAAMPGLLGATMRKDGWYAAFRKDISQSPQAGSHSQTDGLIRVKLFNMVAREIGGLLLQRGVRIDGTDLERIVGRHNDTLLRHIQSMLVDGHPTHPDSSFFLTLIDQPVDLAVTVC